MIPEEPKPGLVLRYAFLWRREAEAGREEATKDRPVLVVVLLAKAGEVIVAPVTTKTPIPGERAIEIPARVRADLGLDADRCWISVATLNRFVWPGPDLRPVPGRKPRTVAYGLVPQRLLDKVKALIIDQLTSNRSGLVVRRSDD